MTNKYDQPLSRSEVHHRQRTRSGILQEDEVAVIKAKLLLELTTPRQLAAQYCVAIGTIRAIERGDTWDWVKANLNPQSKDGEEVQPPDESAAAESLARLQKLLGEGK